MATLNLHTHLTTISPSSPSLSTHFLQPPKLFQIPKQPPKKHKLIPILSCTNNPTSNSSPQIFLPFLQTPQNPEQQKPIKDPILKFFKTRTSDPDPTHEAKISLQNNRRRKTSWHLSPTFPKPEPELKPEESSKSHLYPSTPQNEPQQVVSSKGVVGEILDIFRDLPENVTIGEALERYDFGERLSEDECVEVLRVLGSDENVMGCLYFFEWMGLQEPCLVTPKALSVLFPALGRAGKGDVLLLVFRNLPFEPSSSVFKDVRVYNSAISGLLLCGRYWCLLFVCLLAFFNNVVFSV